MEIKPLKLKRALLFFGIPGVIAGLNVYIFMAYLNDKGLPFFYNWVVIYAIIPMTFLIIASFVFLKREGAGLSWEVIKDRFRLKPMNKGDWLWTIGLLLFMLISAGSLTFTAQWLSSFSFMPFPDYYPDTLNPALREQSMDMTLPTEFIGMSLSGNWWILSLMGFSLIIATLGEELWWRGYILPRQELVYGNKTWITHGLLWASFHLFAPWNIISILPGCLALSYVAQKRKNTWPGIIAHGLANGLLVMVIIFMGIIN